MASRSNKDGSSPLSLVHANSAGDGHRFDSTDQNGVALLDGSSVVQSGSGEFALLQAGQISMEQYLEMSVERAISPLAGSVAEQTLEAMRAVLRDSLENDPQFSVLAAQVAQV